MLSPFLTCDNNNNIIKKNAIIYCRLSKKTDSKSIESQQKECVQFCINNNLTIKNIVSEIVSAYKSGQKKLNDILDTITSNDVIVVWEISRFSRNVIEGAKMMNIIRSKQAGIYIVNDKCGFPSTCDYYDIINKITRAQQESDFISERAKRSIRYKKSIGSYIGVASYGKKIIKNNDKIVLVNNESEINIMKHIYNLYYVINYNITTIVEILNDMCILKRNKLWTKYSIKKIINSYDNDTCNFDMNNLKKVVYQISNDKIKNIPKKSRN